MPSFGAPNEDFVAGFGAPNEDSVTVSPIILRRAYRSDNGLRCFTEMSGGSEAGSYLRRIDSCITRPKAQGPSWTLNESKEEEATLDSSTSSRVRQLEPLTT